MKIVADPLALAWFTLLLASGVEFAARRRKAACILLGVALAASLIQLADIPGRLLANLERPYLPDPQRPLARADAVVVLGGYLQPFSASYTGIEFDQKVGRLFTGIALVRSGKGSVLVLGGSLPAEPGEVSEAEAAEAFIRSWNLVSVTVQSLGTTSNTHDEAVRCSELARRNGWRHLIVVSSAAHLRRTTGAFRKAGLDITPVGCDFRSAGRLGGHTRISCIPNTASLVGLRSWLEEVLGYLYYQVRGWV